MKIQEKTSTEQVRLKLFNETQSNSQFYIFTDFV